MKNNKKNQFISNFAYKLSKAIEDYSSCYISEDRLWRVRGSNTEEEESRRFVNELLQELRDSVAANLGSKDAAEAFLNGHVTYRLTRAFLNANYQGINELIHLNTINYPSPAAANILEAPHEDFDTENQQRFGIRPLWEIFSSVQTRCKTIQDWQTSRDDFHDRNGYYMGEKRPELPTARTLICLGIAE